MADASICERPALAGCRADRTQQKALTSQDHIADFRVCEDTGSLEWKKMAAIASDSVESREPTSVPVGADEAIPVETQRSPAGWASVGIFIILCVAAIIYARVFFTPVVLSFLLALVFTPIRRFLAHRHVPEWASAILIVGSLIGALLAGIYLLSGPVSEWIDHAPSLARDLEDKLRGLRAPVENVVAAGKQVQELASGARDAQEVVVKDSGFAGVVATAVPAVVAQAIFTLTLLFFLIASGDMFYEKIVHVLPTFKDKKTSMRIAFNIEQKLSRYFFTITIINALLGASIGLFMLAAGMPHPLMLAVVGFLLNYIPYLGAAAGVTISTAVALLTFTEPAYAVLVGGAYMMMTFVEGQFITPYFVGRSLKLNTVVVLICVTFWAWAWSVIGMLIAVPILVTLKTFSEHIPQLHSLGAFLAGRGAELEVAAVAEAQEERRMRRPGGRPLSAPAGPGRTS